jgi:hypothetical protein
LDLLSLNISFSIPIKIKTMYKKKIFFRLRRQTGERYLRPTWSRCQKSWTTSKTSRSATTTSRPWTCSEGCTKTFYIHLMNDCHGYCRSQNILRDWKQTGCKNSVESKGLTLGSKIQLHVEYVERNSMFSESSQQF